MLRVPRDVVERMGAVIRDCGRGATECVAYVAAPLPHRGVATEVIHPRHAATATSTVVDEDELERTWDLLLQRGLTLVMQAHSHPGSAYHSSTDDCWPVLHRMGFVSLVLPRFGTRGLYGAHVTTYSGSGRWHQASWQLLDGDLLVCAEVSTDEPHHGT